VEPDALISFLGAVVLLSQPAKDLGRVSQFAIVAGVALERLEAVLSWPERVSSGKAVAPPLRDTLEVRGVSFQWADALALDGCSFTVKRGQVTALVGPSGSGKSTLTSLLLRFEEPASGQVLLDGVDVADFTVDSVRAQFALVTQEPLLFSTTVRENLLVGRSAATPDELEAACRTAMAWDFIQALPQGLNTSIGERGVTLSGGQKQRLCLARALLSQAPVLVLDEATSSLDPENERDVLAALERVLPGHTALVIAHRLSTIQKADTIVVLEAGRVVEQGTHQALLERRGPYARLWLQQSGAGVPA